MAEQVVKKPLQGKVALVAGATRGAGRAIAVELCRAGAFVYATGRSSRKAGPSDMDRPETIEETGDLMQATGGEGSALRVDHLDVDVVADLVARIGAERGRLDVLVNDIFGGHKYTQWDKKVWEHCQRRRKNCQDRRPKVATWLVSYDAPSAAPERAALRSARS